MTFWLNPVGFCEAALRVKCLLFVPLSALSEFSLSLLSALCYGRTLIAGALWSSTARGTICMAALIGPTDRSCSPVMLA